jgi:hypothetical protein
MTVRTQKVEMMDYTRGRRVWEWDRLDPLDPFIDSRFNPDGPARELTVHREAVRPAEISIPIVDGLAARFHVAAVIGRDGAPLVVMSQVDTEIRELELRHREAILARTLEADRRAGQAKWEAAFAKAEAAEVRAMYRGGERGAIELLASMGEGAGGW